GRRGADEKALPDGDVTRGGRNRDEPDDGTDASPERRNFLSVRGIDEYPGQHRGSRSRIRVQKRQDRGLRSGKRRSRVETEPAEPQHPGPQEHEGNIGGNHLLPIRLSRSEKKRAGQSREARGKVNDRTPGKIEHAPFMQKARGVPGPMGQWSVNE